LTEDFIASCVKLDSKNQWTFQGIVLDEWPREVTTDVNYTVGDYKCCRVNELGFFAVK